MQKRWLVIAILAVLMAASSVQAADPDSDEVIRIETRAGVSVPIFMHWRPDAVATLMLFSGGPGGYGKIGDDGWPASGNFLIRTGKLWAAHPFNLVMVGRPSDGIDLGDGAIRIGAEHLADNAALMRAVKVKSPLPIWLVGTSMGTISAAASAIHDDDKLVAGVVLTSSVTGYKVRGAVPMQELSRIRVPTLVVHHARDSCALCTPYEAKDIAEKLTAAPARKTLILDGGSGESGSPCGPMHFHGYIGMEKAVVDQIANWIVHPVN